MEVVETHAGGSSQAYRSRRAAQLFAVPQVGRYPWQRSFEDPSKILPDRRDYIFTTHEMFYTSLGKGKPHYRRKKSSELIRTIN